MTTLNDSEQYSFHTIKILACSLLFLLCAAFVVAENSQKQHQWYVSPSGKPGASGTKEDPFSTLEQAREAIRQSQKDNPDFLSEDHKVLIRQGIYELTGTFQLDENDSGSEKHPVIYTAFPGEKVSVCGAVRISPGKVQPISDPAISDRIIEVDARKQIREINLKDLEIPDSIQWKLAGFGRPYVASGIELFINGNPYVLAGYPNQDKIQIHPEDVIDPGIKDTKAYPGIIRFPSDRIKKWPKESDAMVFGCFTYAWASDQLRIRSIDPEKQEISLADPHVYGISGKKEWNKYRIFNLLEEIDQPGEYYLSNKTGKLTTILILLLHNLIQFLFLYLELPW
jgi:hypothetical protein